MIYTVKDFIDQISLSELYNISWVDNLTGKIHENRIPSIINYINEGLGILFDKFSLKKDQIFLFPVPYKFNYKITSDHMMSEDLIPDYDHYLWKGVDETFDDNLIRIVDIHNSDGHNLPLNDPSDYFSVFIPFYNEIQLSDFQADWELSITYIASPPKLKTINDKIDIPSVLVPALISFVSYKVYNIFNTAEATQTASKYLQMYMSQVNEVVNSDTANYSVPDNPTKFYNRGWK